MISVQLISIAKIHVLNGRARSRAKFQEIVDSITNVGLRKPITVSPRGGGVEGYDLVCGQGRMEAFMARGATEIPAIVVDMPLEDRLLWSLVENLARKKQTSVEMARELLKLKERGYSHAEIAKKVGLSEPYVIDLVRLLENGEDRLVAAVERGEIPITVAADIASSDDATVQRSLREAYESGKLRGKPLLRVKHLIEVRRARGKSFQGGSGRKHKGPSTHDLVRTLERETQKQARTVKKAHLCEQQLRFVLSALRDLFSDEDFVNALRAEQVDELPKYLAEEIHP